MLALRQSAAMMAAPDRFRGTIQRWTIDEGATSGATLDLAFNTD